LGGKERARNSERREKELRPEEKGSVHVEKKKVFGFLKNESEGRGGRGVVVFAYAREKSYSWKEANLFLKGGGWFCQRSGKKGGGILRASCPKGAGLGEAGRPVGKGQRQTARVTAEWDQGRTWRSEARRGLRGVEYLGCPSITDRSKLRTM